MSDGPHRTLNMRKAWKVLVRRADDDAYSHADIVACVAPAVASDWNDEVSAEFFSKVGQFLGCGSQSHLFERDSAEIDRLRGEASSPMEALLADNAKDACESPLQGEAALEDVVGKTLRESVVRRTFQAEEHYLRNSSRLRSVSMRQRLQRAAKAAASAINTMAQNVVRDSRATKPGPAKRQGIGDGPAL